MEEKIISRMTPQRKMIRVNNKFGNVGIKKQQGTTRAIYDSLPIDGSSEYRFFEEAATRGFPFTNMSSEGNRLGVGSALVVERIYFSIMTTDAIVPFTIQSFATMEEFSNINPAIGNSIKAGELSIEIANSQVLKQLSILGFGANYNKSAFHNTQVNFEFDTQIVISPLLEFVLKLRTYTHQSLVDTYIRLTIEGTGAIISPRTTM